jgi:hypothetical protein
MQPAVYFSDLFGKEFELLRVLSAPLRQGNVAPPRRVFRKMLRRCGR